jgi:Ser/Thr protein kinase RdoA (MazF antagonist)
MIRRVEQNRIDAPDAVVIAAFGLAPAPLQPAVSGLINGTWHVASTAGEPLILQRINDIFPAAVNTDIDALTRHLEAKGVTTPRIVPPRTGGLWLEHGGTWRVLTSIPGISRDALESPAQAREAGRVLAAFHRAVADYDRPFANARLGVHDTAARLAALRRALADHAAHPEMRSIAPLAERIFELEARLPALPIATDRVVHGDPKISNILFDPLTDRALCLIDLDTLTRMPIALELGDAMRSWCNPAAEEAGDSRFALPFFAAAIEGYAGAAEGMLEEVEWSAIPAATFTITVELAARFCTDALAERYFRWDSARYPRSSAHQQARTRGQLALAASIEAQLDALGEIVRNAFNGAGVTVP